MLTVLRHLLSPSYLYAQNATPEGVSRSAGWLWVLALLFSCTVCWFWMRRLRVTGRPWRAAGWAAVLGGSAAALAALRPFAVGAWSARIWFLSASDGAVAAAGVQLLILGWPRIVEHLMMVRSRVRSPAWVATAFGAALIAGLLGICWPLGLGPWPAAAVLASWLAHACASAHARRRPWWRSLQVWPLAPLALPYVSWLLNYVLAAGLRLDVLAYQSYPFPDAWSPWFHEGSMLVAGVGGVVVCAASSVAASCGLSPRKAMAWLLCLAGVGWWLGMVALHRSHGATASDPFCYLQAAADLATRGTPTHAYPLAELARQAGLPMWPAVHVGYHTPAAGGESAIVWPIGWPALLAPFLKLGGESAAMWGAPLCACLAALTTVGLAYNVSHSASEGDRWIAAGLAGFITLTSQEAALRALVPMADAAAQLFSVAMLLCLVRARRLDSLAWSTLAGVCLGLAYWMRHPQICLSVGALGLWAAPWTRRRRLCHLALFSLGAVCAAVPDLVYHTRVFGAPWATESPEWFLLSLRNIPSTWGALWHEGAARRSEFGYLWPMILCGVWVQLGPRRGRPYGAMMWMGFVGVLLFNLSYSALRWRDMISVFPWLATWASLGIVAVWERVRDAGQSRTVYSTVFACLVLTYLGARTAPTLAMVRQPRLLVFGYVSPDERSEFARLGRDVPRDAVVAASLNSGAIERYAGHDAVRPYWWSAEEFTRFVQLLATSRRDLYVLDDGQEMEAFLGRMAATGPPQRLGEYALPTFGLGGEHLGRGAVLYRADVPPRGT